MLIVKFYLCRPGNLVLLQFLVGLKQATEDELVAELVVNILKESPDILSRFFKETQYSYTPRIRSAWHDNVKLLKRVTIIDLFSYLETFVWVKSLSFGSFCPFNSLYGHFFIGGTNKLVSKFLIFTDWRMVSTWMWKWSYPPIFSTSSNVWKSTTVSFCCVVRESCPPALTVFMVNNSPPTVANLATCCYIHQLFRQEGRYWAKLEWAGQTF